MSGCREGIGWLIMIGCREGMRSFEGMKGRGVGDWLAEHDEQIMDVDIA